LNICWGEKNGNCTLYVERSITSVIKKNLENIKRLSLLNN
jgi:hypothetical protein